MKERNLFGIIRTTGGSARLPISGYSVQQYCFISG